VQNADSWSCMGRRAKGCMPLQESVLEAPLRRVCPRVHAALYPAHLCTTQTDNTASLPGTSPDLAMKVLQPKKFFTPRQPGPFGDSTITGLWFFRLPWSEGGLPAPARPGGGRLWPSLWWSVSHLLGRPPLLTTPQINGLFSKATSLSLPG